MADIRINSLPTTATSFNTDDYIALDGASGGTRKMLAATLPLTDVTFGSSGPSAKSSIAARASRQGLIFDGTAGVYTGIISGPSTNDFTTACWVNPTSFAASGYLFGNSQPGSFYLGVRVTTGALFTGKSAGASFADTTFSLTAGKNRLLVRVKSGSSVTWYLDGVAIQSGITDSNDYNGGFEYYGSANSSAAIFTGTLIPFIYNRALSAAEVVALYEAGVPAGADYPGTAAGTTLNSSAWVNSNYSTFTSASGSSLSGVYSGSGTQYGYAAPTFVSKYGNTIRFYYDLTLTSGQAPYVILTQIGVKSCSASVTLTAGTGKYVDLVVNDPSSATTIAINNTAASNWSIANARLTPLGLLLAPDAGQAGGGLTWYDTSGNAANITLPASGVSWNVPSSRYLGGNWTTSGNLTVSGASGITTTATNGAGLTHSTAAGSYRGLKLQTSSSDRWLIGANDAAESGSNAGSDLVVFSYSDAGTFLSSALKLVRSTGNLLVGTTTDGGQKLQVAGDAAFTGTSVSGGVAGISVKNTAGSANFTRLNVTGSGFSYGSLTGANSAWFNADGTPMALVTVDAQPIKFLTNYTTALTINSSQNITVEGTGVSQIRGTLLLGNQTAVGASLDVQTANGTASTLRLFQSGVSNWVWSVPASTDALVLSQYGTTEALRFNDSRVAIFSGAVRLNNAYVAGAPTATGYITIQDSTGTTYKIPAVAA